MNRLKIEEIKRRRHDERQLKAIAHEVRSPLERPITYILSKCYFLITFTSTSIAFHQTVLSLIAPGLTDPAAKFCYLSGEIPGGLQILWNATISS